VSERFFRTLARQAATRYPARDRFARHFAYGKLSGDPMFRHVLESGLIPPRARVVDLGSGQGVLAALLIAAKERHASGDWPATWPAPANPSAYVGIELMQKDVDRARAASDGAADHVCGDIRSTQLGAADTVLILDVLHYIDYAEQAQVLRRVRDALRPDGVLLLRVGDASDSWRFRYTVAVDRAVMRLRGHKLARLYNKPLARWKAELAELGFEAETLPMSEGTLFANVLLVARLKRAHQAGEILDPADRGG
jgi:SAM-dependent methyltransferase